MTLHFTPTCSSWLNQVELWFSKVQRDVLSRGIFRSTAGPGAEDSAVHRRLLEASEAVSLEVRQPRSAHHSWRTFFKDSPLGTGHDASYVHYARRFKCVLGLGAETMAHAKDLFERLPSNFQQLDRRSAANLLAARRAVGESRATSLMVGAGVSASVGLPHWNRLVYLVAGTFFEHWTAAFHLSQDRDRVLTPPKQLSIGGIMEYAWPDDIRRLAGAAVLDPVLLIQQIKNCVRPIDWKYLLRKALYKNSPDVSGDSALLNELVYLGQGAQYSKYRQLQLRRHSLASLAQCGYSGCAVVGWRTICTARIRTRVPSARPASQRWRVLTQSSFSLRPSTTKKRQSRIHGAT